MKFASGLAALLALVVMMASAGWFGGQTQPRYFVLGLFTFLACGTYFQKLRK